MREARFIKQNTEKWQAMEQEPTTDPDRLTERFIELTDDLAYARTFYPNARITQYLNELAGRQHRGLMQTKRSDLNRFVHFWQYELPLLFRQTHPLLAVATAIFLLAGVLGWVSAKHDDTFIRLILGDGYVNMTLENIKKGNPLGVYGEGDQGTMFFQITLNNIMIAFRTFIFGLLASFGTVAMLFYNGV
ncbi:MAG: stage II sporulation protein M, partial [Hymenobacter sp.]